MPSELTQWLLPSVPISVPLVLAGLMIMALIGVGIFADFFILVYAIQHPPCWAERIEQVRKRSWSWRETGFVLLVLSAVYVAMGIVVALIHQIYPIPPPRDIAVAFLIIQGIALYASALALILYFMRARRSTWQDSFGLDWPRLPFRIGQGILFYTAAIPPLVVSSLAYIQALRHFDIPIERQDAAQLLTDPQFPMAAKVYLGFLAVVAAPVIEELVFRGLLLASLRRHARTVLAVCATSVLFAAIHFHLPGIVPLFVIAVAFAMAYLYTGSILVPVIMHASFNAVSIVLMILTKDVPLMSWLW